MAITISGSGTITGLSAGGLPDSSVTQPELASGVAGTGPAFSATKSNAQSYSNNVNTKITFPDEQYDTSNCYDASNSRFTPNVAGFYQVNILMLHNYSAGTPTSASVIIFKNGSMELEHNIYQDAIWGGLTMSALIYLNGTTDYIEAYARMNASAEISGSSTRNRFSACLVRAA